MKHEKIASFPYGLTEAEANELFKSTSGDIYDILETFDTLKDALEFIKDLYGIAAYSYAKEDAEQNITEEKALIEYNHNNGNIDYIGCASFDISNGVENHKKGIRNEPSFFWFSSGRIVRVILY